jgi:nuclear pore complex protein Nup88
VAYVELPSNLPSLEAKQQGPSVKSARYVIHYIEIIQVNISIKLPLNSFIFRSSYIDQKFLLCNSRIRIQEVKFHPGSPTNSHVVVLTSDNCIRYVYTEQVF